MRNSFKDKELKRFAELLTCETRQKAKQRLNGYRMGLIQAGVKSPTRLKRIKFLENFIDSM